MVITRCADLSGSRVVGKRNRGYILFKPRRFKVPTSYGKQINLWHITPACVTLFQRWPLLSLFTFYSYMPVMPELSLQISMQVFKKKALCGFIILNYTRDIVCDVKRCAMTSDAKSVQALPPHWKHCLENISVGSLWPFLPVSWSLLLSLYHRSNAGG